MEICVVAALNRRRVIGLENRLPWHLPADLRHFKALTLGKPVIMGRSTHESIGRPLPRRPNIVLSRRAGLTIEGCVTATTLDEALGLAAGASQVMIIGGAQVYAQAVPLAGRLYLTHVENDLEGDAWFPEIDDALWRPVEEARHAADGENPYACRFVIYERRAAANGAPAPRVVSAQAVNDGPASSAAPGA